MLCRALLAAIAISYLICVLFLSGIQKEDLDVTLLRKLQRYNVDFDDFNNQKLRKDCLNNSDSNISKEDNDRSSEQNITIAEDTTITESTSKADYFEKINATEFESVIKYLKNRKKSRIDSTTTLNADITKSSNMKILDDVVTESYRKQNIVSEITPITEQYFIEEDVMKFLESYVKRVKSKISINNNTEIKATTEKPRNNLTHLDVNKSDTTNFKEVERISKAVAEFLTKKVALPVETQTETAKKVTNFEPSQANAQEIEQKLASGLAAINKLNENISILQKNMNIGKYQSSESNNQTRESLESNNKPNKGVADPSNKGLAEGVVILSRDSVQNIANNIQIDQSQHLPKTQSHEAIKTYRINNYSYDSQNEFDDNLTKQTINVDTSRNNQPQFSSHAKNSLDLVSYDYNNKQNQAGMPMQSFEGDVKSGQLQYLPNPQEMINYGYANQNIPNSMIVGTNSNSNILKYNNFASQSHNLQEIMNHGYNQQRAPESNTMTIPKDEQNNPNLYEPISPDLFHNNYNRAKETESNLQNTQYTEFSFNSDQPQALFDGIQNPYDKRQPDNVANNVQNKIDKLNNNQILHSLYPKISQDTINSNHERQIEHDAHVMEVQNIDDKLKNRLQYSTYNQNSQDTVSYNYDKQRADPYASNTPNFNQKRIQLKADDGKETKKDPLQSISSDMILQIAESVKELVLRDLRKDITSPTSTTSSTTLTTFTTTKKSPVVSSPTWTTPETTKPPTIKPVTIVPTTLITSTNTPLTTASKTNDTTTPRKIDLNHMQKATQAIEKFIELFEQFKVVQEKTVNQKERRIILPKHVAAKPFQLPIVMIPQGLPPTNPYGIAIQPKPMPIIVEHFIPPQLTHPPIPQNLIPHTMESMHNIITPIHQEQRFDPRNYPPPPVMIQTNVNEIQPLGIPMAKPESMNFNIILTTQNPFWTRVERGRWNFMKKYGRNPDKRDDIKNVKESLTSYSNVKVNNYATNNIEPSDNNAPNKNTESKLFVNYKGQINDEKTRLNFLNSYNIDNNRYLDNVANQNRLTSQQDNLPLGYITEFERTGNKDKMGHEYKSELSPMANFKNNVNNTFYKDVTELPKINKNELDNPTKKNEDFISRGISEQSAPSFISNIKNDKSKYTGLSPMIDENHVFQYETPPEQHFSNHEEHFNSKLTDLPNGFQNAYNRDDTSIIKKEQISDRTNQFNTFGMLPKDTNKYYENHDINPNMSNQEKHLNDAFKTIHEYYENSNWQQKSRLNNQIHNSKMPGIMPTKTIGAGFNRPNMHLNNYVNNLNMIQKNEDESKLNANNKNTNIYKQNYPYDMQQTIIKDKFKDLEKYLDNSRQIQSMTIRESQNNFKDTPNFKKFINNVKIHRPTNENKVADRNIDTHYSYPSNFENRLTEHSSPYQELDISSRYKTRSESIQRQDVRSWYKNRKDTNNQDHHHLDLISAMMGGRPKSSKEMQDLESAKNSHGNHEYRSQVESLYARPNNRRPQMESSDGEMRINQKTTYDTSDSEKQYPNMGVRGFHEKLEGSDSWPDSTSDCGLDERCSVKILSRQQLPLGGLKKKKYDDSHFKNFLKTQQKVNQMLERILATKSDGVRSVEAV